MKIKRNDTVQVISGDDKGKTGKVLQVFPENEKVLVEGLNLVKKAERRSESNPQGGFSEKEAPMHVSKVMLYHPELKKGVKVRIDRTSGKRVRKCRTTDYSFDG